jgi:DNA-binding transcriptional LysR family regulator
MKHSLPSLDSLKVFESAARHLSFSIAANELCVTKGAVSYQIRKLEEELQSSLFKRSVRQVYLTDIGQALYLTTKKIFEDLENSLSRIQEGKQEANVSIAATTYVAARWLSARIGRFNDEYPDINFLLQHSVNSVDFKLDEVDLAILWGPCKGKLDRNRFAEIPMSLFPVISPKLLDTHKLSQQTELSMDAIVQGALSNIPLLCEDSKQDQWQEWLKANNTAGPDLKLNNPRRVISDANVRVQAAVDGQGLILADDLMLNELNNGLLVAPFKEQLTGYGYAFYSSPTRIYGDNTITFKHWMMQRIQ